MENIGYRDLNDLPPAAGGGSVMMNDEGDNLNQRSCEPQLSGSQDGRRAYFGPPRRGALDPVKLLYKRCRHENI